MGFDSAATDDRLFKAEQRDTDCGDLCASFDRERSHNGNGMLGQHSFVDFTK